MSTQEQVWANKIAKGFNTTDVPFEFCLLQGEVAEAFDAWKGARPGLGEELADVAIFLYGLAQMVGTDLDSEVSVKVAKNADRTYRPDGHGWSPTTSVRRRPMTDHGTEKARRTRVVRVRLPRDRSFVYACLRPERGGFTLDVRLIRRRYYSPKRVEVMSLRIPPAGGEDCG